MKNGLGSNANFCKTYVTNFKLYLQLNIILSIPIDFINKLKK